MLVITCNKQIKFVFSIAKIKSQKLKMSYFELVYEKDEILNYYCFGSSPYSLEPFSPSVTARIKL